MVLPDACFPMSSRTPAESLPHVWSPMPFRRVAVESIGLATDLHRFRLVRIKSCIFNRNGYNYKPRLSTLENFYYQSILMLFSLLMDYEIYHDESKEHGYWHSILLVPTATKPIIIKHLKQVRAYTGYEHPLSFKNITAIKTVFRCAEAWLGFAIGSMITKFNFNYPYQICTGERVRGQNKYAIFDNLVERHPLGVKSILFRDRDQFENMHDSLDYGGKIETSFRTAVKGGLHYLFSEDNHAHIVKIHFDGHEHYGRNVDPERIVDRLNGLRDYCQFKENCPIDDGCSDHREENSQEYDDCQLLQLTDLFVGSFRTAYGFLGQGEIQEQRKLADPVKELVKRYKQGYARMQNSRWRNSFCVSESFIEDGKWQFQNLEYAESQKKQQRTFWDEQEESAIF